MTNASILSLPTELVLQIVSDTDDSSLLALLLCCRTLSYLLSPTLHTRALTPHGNLSAIQWAVTRSDVCLIKYLLAHGMHPDTGVSNTCPPALHTAVCLRRANIVDLLASHGADVKYQKRNDCFGLESASYIAASNSDIATIKLLAAHGADVDSENVMGSFFSTPLHVAVVCHSVPTVRILLELGARVDIEDSACETPLDLAATAACYFADTKEWQEELVVIGMILVQAGAEVRYTEESLEMLVDQRGEEKNLKFQRIMVAAKKAMGGM